MTDLTTLCHMLKTGVACPEAAEAAWDRCEHFIHCLDATPTEQKEAA